MSDNPFWEKETKILNEAVKSISKDKNDYIKTLMLTSSEDLPKLLEERKATNADIVKTYNIQTLQGCILSLLAEASKAS